MDKFYESEKNSWLGNVKKSKPLINFFIKDKRKISDKELLIVRKLDLIKAFS